MVTTYMLDKCTFIKMATPKYLYFASCKVYGILYDLSKTTSKDFKHIFSYLFTQLWKAILVIQELWVVNFTN